MSGIIKGITIIYLSVPDVVISCAGFPILLTSKTTTGDIYIFHWTLLRSGIAWNWNPTLCPELLWELFKWFVGIISDGLLFGSYE